MYFLYACGILCSASSFHDLPLSVLSFNLPTVHMSVSFFISSPQLVTTGTIQELSKHLANSLYMYIIVYIYKWIYIYIWWKMKQTPMYSLVTSCWNYSLTCDVWYQTSYLKLITPMIPDECSGWTWSWHAIDRLIPIHSKIHRIPNPCIWSNYSDVTGVPGPPKGSVLEGKCPYFSEIHVGEIL